VADPLHKRFPGSRYESAWFCVVGDLNDEPLSARYNPWSMRQGSSMCLSAIPKMIAGRTGTAQRTELVSSTTCSSRRHWLPRRRIQHRRSSGAGSASPRILAGGGIGPKVTHLQRFDGDPDPVDVNFRFERFEGVTPGAYASEHCLLL
jgi:hypothetical protein